MSSQDDPAAACPVDHKTREAWLAQARANGTPRANPHDSSPPTTQPAPQAQSSSPVQQSCDSSALDQSNVSLSPPPATSLLSSTRLATDREVSTIPRAHPSNLSSSTKAARPANSEHDTGSDKSTGNWIYPSERMFFDAMRRKNFSPEERDMRAIIPIHNAVNERAWAEIKDWERGQGGEKCGGPRLESFSGLSTTLTPRARWKALMGYQTPFDRHDWVVDRCGKRIEYVIDFYQGKRSRGPNGGLSFYLDVRPKINTWEGVRMRVAKYWGFA